MLVFHLSISWQANTQFWNTIRKEIGLLWCCHLSRTFERNDSLVRLFTILRIQLATFQKSLAEDRVSAIRHPSSLRPQSKQHFQRTVEAKMNTIALDGHCLKRSKTHENTIVPVSLSHCAVSLDRGNFKSNSPDRPDRRRYRISITHNPSQIRSCQKSWLQWSTPIIAENTPESPVYWRVKPRENTTDSPTHQHASWQTNQLWRVRSRMYQRRNSH